MHLAAALRLAPLVLAGAGALAAGCDLVTYRPPVGRDFGAPYAVRAGVPIRLNPGTLVQTPAVDASRRLFAVLEYEGGCREHTFVAESDASIGERTVVWLVHDDGGDRCDELVRDTVVVDLGDAYRPGALVLETPQGETVAMTSLVAGGG